MCQVSISERSFQIEPVARWWTIVPIVLAGCVAQMAPAVASPQVNGWMRDLQAYDQKLATIGYRLQAAGGDLCSRHQPLIGIAVQDLSQYDRQYQAAAAQEFGFDGYPEVLAVASGSPFDTAGVHLDDSILAIDGVDVPGVSRGAHSSAGRVLAVNRQLDEAARDGVVTLTLQRHGEVRRVRVLLEQGCGTRFQTSASDAVGAAADGDTVEVDTGAMRFAESDAEIAAVAAHELAHNILRHQERLAKAGVGNARGARNARLTRQTEEEADRLSAYLMDRAGYEPEAIISFWRRMISGPDARPGAFPTHGSPAERIRIVTGEIARIAEMKARGQVPRPAFMAGTALPELR